MKDQFNRIETIERMIESGTARTVTEGGMTKMSLDPMIIHEENENEDKNNNNNQD